jgi:hypothetical protein
MKIRMIEQRSGGRYDGRAWPAVGVDFDVPDEEGAGLCAQGSAIPVAVKDADVEERGAESPAEPPEDAPVPKPAVNAPKAAWIAYVKAHGMAEDEAAGMSKADLIAAQG